MPRDSADALTLALAGDVMTGRGVDQILPTPSDPVLYEPYVTDARRYVELAESAHGEVPRGVPPDYIWGEAPAALERSGASLRVINLETAVTTSADPWPGKGIHYRMHPANVSCLTAFAPDCCVLANNHVLDWGRDGLTQTLDTLAKAGLRTAGAGRDAEEATAPAILPRPDGGRVLVFALGHGSSGIPADWAAAPGRPGVAYLPDLSVETASRTADRIRAARRPEDTVIVSIHWGDNWGYRVPADHIDFAHALIDEAGVDLIHGHSSHHPRPLEVYRDRLILYGCGDLVNDYEGIGGHERYRPELSLIYVPTLHAGRLASLRMIPFRVRRLRLEAASTDDARWLAETLDRESRRLGTGVRLDPNGRLSVE